MARKVSIDVAINDAQVMAGFRSISRSANTFERDLSRATRGAIAGSGAFRAMGRSLIFASGGFLAFSGVAGFLRKSVDAAREAQIANAQLATQLAASGQSFAAYRSEIDSTVSRLSALAGIEDDELKSGLTTILRTVPNVTKALDDLGLAADLARARHISLAQAAVIIAKTEAGNTTLLRRQGFLIAKNATVEQALAAVRAKVAGQAKAGTTAQERFGAVLHQTEEIIGQGILPTLNKYLAVGSKWLQQMNESGKLQKDVSAAAEGFAGALKATASVVKDVNKATGGFKNTLEILLALKFASIVSRWSRALRVFALEEVAVNQSAVVGRVNAYAGAIQTTGRNAQVASGEVAVLRRSLSGLAAIQIAPILIPLEIKIGSKERELLNRLGKIGAIPKALLDIATAGGAVTGGNLITDLTGLGGSDGKKTTKAAQDQVKDFFAKAAKLAKEGAEQVTVAIQTATKKAGPGLTADQRNTFFDNAIARLLLRTGLGSIQQQIAGLEAADKLIAARLKVTKDVTRRLNLEDELLQNEAQIKSLRAQAVADALQARQDARQKALDALAAAAAARTSRQFRALGFTSTGENVVPGVARLRKELGTLEDGVKGTFLDTAKTQSVFTKIRRVLSGQLGAVGRDVRERIQEILASINHQLDNQTRSMTKFKHANANALLAGLGLDAETVRILRQRLAQIGAGGTLPGLASPAFAGAGATTVNTTVNLDGKKVAANTTKHQRRQNMRRSDSRRGPYAGRN